MVQVVAALIRDGERFLVCQRPAHKARGLLWEFVGGKVEEGETRGQALVRECREELDITVKPGGIFMELDHEYPDLTIHLTLFDAVIAEGEPKKLEHADIRWITTDGIDELSFCPADAQILRELKTRMPTVQARLFALQDEKYRDFTAPLLPTIDKGGMIGVRIPRIRALAKEMEKAGEADDFLTRLPHAWFEENILHAAILSDLKDYDRTIEALDAFLPYVDNWSVCDTLIPRAFKACPPFLPAKIRVWLASPEPYTVRFGLGTLMRFYLDKTFSPEYLAWAAQVRSEEYYVNMMIAWYFATALAKQYDAAIPYLEEKRLAPWTHNKTIGKAIESFRVTQEHKDHLKTLKIRE